MDRRRKARRAGIRSGRRRWRDIENELWEDEIENFHPTGTVREEEGGKK